LDIKVSVFIISRRCNFLRLIHILFFSPPYNMAGIKPSDRNLLICPVVATVHFVAFKIFINRKSVFIICLQKKQAKLIKKTRYRG